MSWWEAAARWYGVIFGATLAYAPVVRWLCASLSDRGSSMLVPLALLLSVWPVWFASAAFSVPYATAALIGIAVVGGALGWAALLRAKSVDRRWMRQVLLCQLVFIGMFLGALWLRGYTPDLTGTEKPMDVAFLAGSERASLMPPPDPWYAGEPINYYYLGYVLLGSVARTAGIPATTAFNLAIPTLFAATFLAAAGFGWNVIRSSLGARAATGGAMLSGFFVAVAGNLYAPLQLGRGGQATIDAPWWDTATGIGWRSSRIVCDGPRQAGRCAFPSVETINEFPFFSFLLGDLHPHVMALPLTIAILGLTLTWFQTRRDQARPDRSMPWRALVGGAIVGSLYALNSWDFPTYLLLLLGALWMATGKTFRYWWKPALLATTASLLAWLPFWLRFVPPSFHPADQISGFARIPIVSRIADLVGATFGQKTSLTEFFLIFGIPLVLALLLLVSNVAYLPKAVATWPGWTWMVTILSFTLFAFVLNAPVLALAGVGSVTALRAVAALPGGSPRFVASALFGVGLAIAAVVEVFYLRDVFENRMNTLFKMYYQVWVLFALAAALVITVLWADYRSILWRRIALASFTVVAVVAASVYPVLGSYQWTDRFGTWRGIDGMAYVRAQNPDEWAAITWLRQHAAPNDVIVEAAGCSYKPNSELPFNRVSAYTGLPTIIGWGDNHQRQWRRGQPDLIAAIPDREAQVAAIFENPGTQALDSSVAPDWLYVGIYERGDWQDICPSAGPYPGIDRHGFPGDGWVEAFQSGEVAIYHRTLDEN